MIMVIMYLRGRWGFKFFGDTQQPTLKYFNCTSFFEVSYKGWQIEGSRVWGLPRLPAHFWYCNTHLKHLAYATTRIAGLWAGILWCHRLFLFRLWAAPTVWREKMLRTWDLVASCWEGQPRFAPWWQLHSLNNLWLMRLNWSWRKKEFGVGQYVEPWGENTDKSQDKRLWVRIVWGTVPPPPLQPPYPQPSPPAAGLGLGRGVVVLTQASLSALASAADAGWLSQATLDQCWGAGLWVVDRCASPQEPHQTVCIHHRVTPPVTELLANQCSEMTEILISD